MKTLSAVFPLICFGFGCYVNWFSYLSPYNDIIREVQLQWFQSFGIYSAAADNVEPPIQPPPVPPKAPQLVEFFSSTKKLSVLYQKEKEYVQVMEEFLSQMEQAFKPMMKYIKYRKFLTSKAIPPLAIASHPVDAFVLIRRFTAGWQEITLQLEKAMSHLKGYIEWSKVLQLEDNNFPKQSDLAGAALGLVRLQHDYQLDLNDLERGIVKSPAFNTEFRGIERLAPYDLQQLGIRSAETGYFSNAVQWFELSLKRYVELGIHADVEIIREQLLQTVTVHDKAVEDKLNGTDIGSSITADRPFDKARATILDQKTPQVPKLEFQPLLHQEQTYDQIMDHYARLCKGDRLRTVSEESSLLCHVRSPHPSLLLQPIKIEEMNLEPYIIIIHDLLFPSQTEKIINLTDTHELYRSAHHGGGHGGREVVTSDIRTSQNVWLSDSFDPVIRSVTKRIEAVTNLLVKDPYPGEMYQVANYGVGGLYHPHADFFDIESSKGDVAEHGNRLATLMIYLTDVTAGGGTAFPRSGVTLWPERGAGALWYNLYSDGNHDQDTIHGACSVLHGSKWIMNKWIRMNGQFQNFPCGLVPYTRHHEP